MNNYQSVTYKVTILFTISILGLLLFSQSLLAKEKKLYEKNFPVDSGETLILESQTGDVIIESWNQNEVSILVYGNSNAEEKLDFTFDKISSGVKIKAEKNSEWSSWNNSISLTYKIKIPTTFNTEIETAGGDIKLSNTKGDLVLKTSGGDITVNNSSGDLVAKTSGGDVKIKSFNGNTELKTSGGDISAKALSGSVNASTSGGDIKLDVSSGEIVAKTSGGDIRVNYTGENKGINLLTSGGDVSVKLPDNFQADATLKTSGGDAECNFSPVSAEKITKSKFIGKLNKGGLELYCSTSGGDVTVSNK